MTGVWGQFIEYFPELYETMTVEETGKLIRGIMLPSKGLSAVRKRFRQDTGVELSDSDLFAVNVNTSLEIGQTVFSCNNKRRYRLACRMNYSRVGNFEVYALERIQGPTSDNALVIKKARYN